MLPRESSPPIGCSANGRWARSSACRWPRTTSYSARSTSKPRRRIPSPRAGSRCWSCSPRRRRSRCGMPTWSRSYGRRSKALGDAPRSWSSSSTASPSSSGERGRTAPSISSTDDGSSSSASRTAFRRAGIRRPSVGRPTSIPTTSEASSRTGGRICRSRCRTSTCFACAAPTVSIAGTWRGVSRTATTPARSSDGTASCSTSRI
jgi:hypothetical protein